VELITPFSVDERNTVQCFSCARLADMDLKDIRVERLKLFARKHGVESSPGELARLIGKKPNQVTNLLGKHSSFGEKVARSIEQAAGLSAGWLDVEGAEDDARPSDHLAADLAELAAQVSKLPPKHRHVALAHIRQILDLVNETLQATEESVTDNSEVDKPQDDTSAKRAIGG
jgi:hypothetical protein